jgi:hypothetical protein
VIPETDVNTFQRKFFTNGVSGSNMIVNGSATPVVFSYLADPDFDLILLETRIVMSAGTIAVDGDSFGKGGGSLPNGVLIESISDGSLVEIANVQVNEEMFLLPFVEAPIFDTAGANDILTLSIRLGATLRAGSGDLVRITIRDQMLGGARDMKFFQAVGVSDEIEAAA